MWSVRRLLARVGWSLDDLLDGRAVALPPLPRHADGWLAVSVPADLVDELARPGFILTVRQRYRRYHTDLGGTYDGWLAGLSGATRASLRRKAKKLARYPGEAEVRAYRTPDELRAFHALARPLAARTYQARLLGAGLPGGSAFLAEAAALAAADRVRAWLLFLDGRPIAYLWCSAEGVSLRYDHLGYDPAFAELSPGTVLHARAFADLFAERRFARFDFTGGEGRHKRRFATGSVACADVLLLRDTPANRAVAAALRAFDAGVGLAKRLVAHPRCAGLRRRLTRGA